MSQSHRLNNEGLINRNKEIVFSLKGLTPAQKDAITL